MGVSTDASFAFGIDLGEELPEAWAEYDDFEFDDLIAKEAGFEEPKEEYDRNNEALMKRFSDYWDQKREAAKTFPVDLIRHCSGDCPMWILAVRGTERTANRGYPQAFDPKDISVTDDQIAALKDFCARHQIEWKEPQWLLYSDWN